MPLSADHADAPDRAVRPDGQGTDSVIRTGEKHGGTVEAHYHDALTCGDHIHRHAEFIGLNGAAGAGPAGNSDTVFLLLLIIEALTDKALSLQLGHFHIGLRGKRMIRRQEHKGLLRKQLAVHQPVSPDLPGTHGKIHYALIQVIHDDGVMVDKILQLHRLVALEKLIEQCRAQPQRSAVHRSPPLPVAPHIAELADCFIQLLKRQTSTVHEHPSGLREHHTAAKAVKKGDPQFLLQLAYGYAHRGLGHVHLRCGPGDVLCSGCRRKVFQLLNIHTVPPLPASNITVHRFAFFDGFHYNHPQYI